MMIVKRINFKHLLRIGVLVVYNVCIAQISTDDLTKTQLFENAMKDYHSFELAHGHTIQTENVNMHYLTWGDPKALPIVWIHGTGSDSYELISFADSIVAMGCYLISIDYYGHGQTPIPQKEVSVYHVADDIKFLIDSLGINKVLIGGFSRGGTIATAFYDVYPENVLGIILEDGGSVNWRRPYHKVGLDSVKVKIKEWFTPLDTAPSFSNQKEAFMYYYNEKDTTSQFQLLNSIRMSDSNGWDQNPGLWKWLDEDSTEGLIKSIFNSTLSPMFEYSTINLEPRIVYRNLSVPMLIFDPQSDSDWNMDFTEENKALAEKHPELITHKIYENTGHAVKFQRPERFIKDLAQFVNKVKLHHKIE